jgi:hypothetical protein
MRHIVARDVAAEARRMPLLYIIVQTAVRRRRGCVGQTIGSVLLYGRPKTFICPLPVSDVLSELVNSFWTKS